MCALTHARVCCSKTRARAFNEHTCVLLRHMHTRLCGWNAPTRCVFYHSSTPFCALSWKTHTCVLHQHTHVCFHARTCVLLQNTWPVHSMNTRMCCCDTCRHDSVGGTHQQVCVAYPKQHTVLLISRCTHGRGFGRSGERGP